MLYSCFNDKMRLYEVFEDDRGHAMNGDLPVPSLPAPVNGIGVPSTDAGRPLPRDARRVGTSWLPRGLVVQCQVTSIRGLGSTSMGDASNLAVFGVATLLGLAGAWWLGKESFR